VRLGAAGSSASPLPLNNRAAPHPTGAGLRRAPGEVGTAVGWPWADPGSVGCGERPSRLWQLVPGPRGVPRWPVKSVLPRLDGSVLGGGGLAAGVFGRSCAQGCEA